MNRFASALALAGLVAVASSAGAQDRAPYLQVGTSDGVTITWRTSAAQDGVVCWGDDPGSLVNRVAGPNGRQHEVRVTGLSAASVYYYQVTDGVCPPAAGGDDNRWFETAPTVGNRDGFTFWVVGDSGTGGSAQARVRDAMLSHVGDYAPELFLHMGDMAYSSGTTGEFDDHFFAMYEQILEHTVCWPTLGNHEARSSDSGGESGPYYTAYVLPSDGVAGGLPTGTEAYYSFDYANVHFIVLDSADSPRRRGSMMLDWLEADLASTDQDWIVAYFHHPPYTKGSHDSDTESTHVDMREHATPILEAGGVDLVFGGHSHIYERSYLVHGGYDTPTTDSAILDFGDGSDDGDGPYVKDIDGTVYVVAGHGGTGVSGAGDHPLMYFSEVRNGSVLVDVTGSSLTVENIRSDGAVTDRMVLVKGEGLFLTAPSGGTAHLAGSIVDIGWASVGDTGDVRLEYSVDGGGWVPIVEATPNDGAHSWSTPLLVSSAVRVRVTDTLDPASTDTSGPFALVDTTSIDLVPWGGVWEFHDTRDDPGPSWAMTTGGWESGPAELGYGEGDEATELRDLDPNVPTAYFRTSAVIRGEVLGARFRLLYDDGAAVFVNGVEVHRENIDSTAHDDFALGTSADNSIVTGTIAGSAFRDGDNVIAVLVKQTSGSSSDVSFNFSLTLDVRVDVPDPPPLLDGGVASDGGASPDSAVADAAVDAAADGSTPDGGPVKGISGGCGCRVGARTSDGAAPALMALGLGLGALRRRRRR